MQTRTPAISVIIPMKDSKSFILAALKSVLIQEITPHEILVIDDGSSDGSRQLVVDFNGGNRRLILLDGPGKGPAAARNVGLDRASGDIIAFLDSDDMWPRDKLAVQLARIARGPAVDMVSGFTQYFTDRLDMGLTPDPESVTDEMFHVHLGACIFRRSVFERLGNFDENFTYAEDVDLMLRLRDSKLPMTILDHVTLYYRRHDQSMTARYTATEKRDFHRALMRSMSRRKVDGRLIPLAPFSSLIERMPEP